MDSGRTPGGWAEARPYVIDAVRRTAARTRDERRARATVLRRVHWAMLGATARLGGLAGVMALTGTSPMWAAATGTAAGTTGLLQLATNPARRSGVHLKHGHELRSLSKMLWKERKTLTADDLDRLQEEHREALKGFYVKAR